MRPERHHELHALRAVLALGDGVDLARRAARRFPELGQVLLATLNGALPGSAEAGALLEGSAHVQTLLPPSPALAAALDALPAPPQAPGEREVWVRGLAACLLAPAAARRAPLPAPITAAAPLPPLGTLSRVWDDEERWSLAVERALSSAQQGGQGCLTLAVRSWGDWLGARALLTGRYGAAVGGLGAPICVITLEDAVRLLSAASAWTLPDLAGLLAGPLLLDGLETLGAQEQRLVSELLADTARVFGFSALLLSAGPLELPGWPELAAPPPAGTSVPHLPDTVTMTLERLAAAVRAAEADTLVVLPSRGSAARLAALLPGSVLWSSSLCPVHLGEVARSASERRRSGERCLVVATSLPPLQLGAFETVWHTVAPLPYLVEAFKRCSGSVHRLRLSDVALPVQWAAALGITDELLQHGLLPGEWPQALGRYLAWAAQEGAAQAGPDLGRLRAGLDFPALESALRVRPATSRPALIAYDAEARTLAQQSGVLGHLPPAALRYAAWLTPSEADLAVSRGQARPLGWALLWDAPYDPVYGLAGKLIEDTRYARGG